MSNIFSQILIYLGHRIIFFKDCCIAVFIFYIWRVNWRLNITALLVALAFFGVSLEQSNTDPNQEILVQFNTDSISVLQAQRAVSDIKNQLKAIGVEDVQVSETSDGRLKVTYYSTIDVAVIKSLFFKHNKLRYGNSPLEGNDVPSKTPIGTDSNTYIVDVVKIQSDFNYDLSLQGVLVEVKAANDQYVKPKLSLDASSIDIELRYTVESDLNSGYRIISLVEDNANYKIPEVRAGPIS